MRRAIALVTLLLAAPSQAQNALGDGRVLDNNLQRGVRTNASRTRIADEVRFRNSIVTGNSATFGNFRGELPYTAADDFRADLGSNDLFEFRRDSFVSSLPTRGIRQADALQYQLALTTGARPPSGLIGGLTTDRFGVGRSGSGAISGRLELDRNETLRQRTAFEAGSDPRGTGLLDRGAFELGSSLSTLRSTSAYLTSESLEPELVGFFRPRADADGEAETAALTASPLRGLQRRVLPRSDEEEAEARRRDDERRGQIRNRLEADSPGGDAIENAITPQRIPSAYDAFLDATDEALRARPSEDDEAEPAPSIRRWLDEIREFVAPIQLDESEGDADAPDESSDDAGPGTAALIEAELLGLDPALEALRESSRIPLERFVARDDATVYAQHMRAGQELLSAERYFDAEERFALALLAAPGDPSASVARLHAQLGAGLYLSAAVNLRELAKQTPELLAARFDASLLPARERLSELADALAGYADPEAEGPARSARLRRASGLLLAYVARQLEDRDRVVRGLALVEENAEDRKLAALLRRLWLPAPGAERVP